ncbi:nucleoside phosphorylase domain-containing protein [Aspergillus multicolor]|uniref:nucleoside phosphorylase domain-containing protein n=1 Tax=Aspergillus multicolor TaxID=41759 RepID=UPI003CCD380C
MAFQFFGVDPDKRSPYFNEDYTVGWICNSSESLTAVGRIMTESWDFPRTFPVDEPRILKVGTIGRHKVAATIAQCHNYGTNHPSGVISGLLNTFPNICLLLMVGVAAGMPFNSEPIQDVRLGDVVVGTPSNDTPGGVVVYHGHCDRRGRKLKRKLGNVPTALRDALYRIQGKGDLSIGSCVSTTIDEAVKRNPALSSKYSRPAPSTDRLFQQEYKHANRNEPCTKCDATKIIPSDNSKREGGHPIVHYGTILSAIYQVYSTKQDLEPTQDAICYDSEAISFNYRLPMLVIRGITNYGDSHANKTWEGYAAIAAAAYAQELLLATSARELAKAPLASDALRD